MKLNKSPRGIVYNSSLAKEKEKCTMFEMEKEQGVNHQVYDSIRTQNEKTILKLHKERKKE